MESVTPAEASRLLFIWLPQPLADSEFVLVPMPPVRFRLGIHPALAIARFTLLLSMASCEVFISGRFSRACS